MKRVFQGFEAETIERKAQWFRSLSMEERARVFCGFYSLITALNPGIIEKKHARPTQAGICVLRQE